MRLRFFRQVYWAVSGSCSGPPDYVCDHVGTALAGPSNNIFEQAKVVACVPQPTGICLEIREEVFVPGIARFVGFGPPANQAGNGVHSFRRSGPFP